MVCVRISFASLIFTKNVVEVWGRPKKVDFVGKNSALQHANWCIAASELVHCNTRIGAPHHRKSLGVAASHSHTSHVGGSGNA